MFDGLFKKKRELQSEGDLDKVLEYYVELRRSGQPFEPRGARFEFECSRRWEDLEPTRDSAVRRCEECQRSVYFAPSEATFQEHAAAGRCVAIIDDQVGDRLEDMPRYFGRELPLEEGSRCLVLLDPYQALETAVHSDLGSKLRVGQPAPPELSAMPGFVKELLETTAVPEIPERFLSLPVLARQAERLRHPETLQQRLEALILYATLCGWKRPTGAEQDEPA